MLKRKLKVYIRYALFIKPTWDWTIFRTWLTQNIEKRVILKREKLVLVRWRTYFCPTRQFVTHSRHSPSISSFVSRQVRLENGKLSVPAWVELNSSRNFLKLASSRLGSEPILMVTKLCELQSLFYQRGANFLQVVQSHGDLWKTFGKTINTWCYTVYGRSCFCVWYMHIVYITL